MMAEYWLLSFSPFFPLTVKVHKKRKKERSVFNHPVQKLKYIVSHTFAFPSDENVLRS